MCLLKCHTINQGFNWTDVLKNAILGKVIMSIPGNSYGVIFLTEENIKCPGSFRALIKCCRTNFKSVSIVILTYDVPQVFLTGLLVFQNIPSISPIAVWYMLHIFYRVPELLDVLGISALARYLHFCSLMIWTLKVLNC